MSEQHLLQATAPARHGHAELRHRLGQLPLFAELSPPLLDAICHHGRPWRSNDGKLLFLRGDPESFVAIVLSGAVHLSIQGSNGREVIVHRASGGELVGETALLHPARRDYTATLGDATQLLLLHQPHFALLCGDPLLQLRIHQQLRARIRQTSSFVEGICLHQLDTRLARFLLEQAARCGQPHPDGVCLPRLGSQGTLAAMLNASRPKLNAQLQAWQRAGLIRCLPHAVLLCDLPQLQRLAQINANQ